MKISILVLVHNAEQYIEKCARSLFGQTYGDIEYVFVNDATPDRSMEILGHVAAGYPSRAKHIKTIVNPRNMGIAASRNTALANATGEYVLFVDSDDCLDTRAVEILAAKAVADDADIAVNDSVMVYERFQYVCRENIPAAKEDYIRDLLCRRARAAMWAKMVRRELFTRHGLKFVEGMDYGEDFYLSPILAYHANRVVKADDAFYYYVCHNEMSISNTLSKRKVDNVVLAARLLEEFFSQVPESEVYAPMLGCMKLRNKLAVIQAGNKEIWKYAAELYPEIDYRRFDLSMPERLAMWLTGHGMWGVMSLYKTASKLNKRLLISKDKFPAACGERIKLFLKIPRCK